MGRKHLKWERNMHSMNFNYYNFDLIMKCLHVSILFISFKNPYKRYFQGVKDIFVIFDQKKLKKVHILCVREL